MTAPTSSVRQPANCRASHAAATRSAVVQCPSAPTRMVGGGRFSRSLRPQGRCRAKANAAPHTHHRRRGASAFESFGCEPWVRALVDRSRPIARFAAAKDRRRHRDARSGGTPDRRPPTGRYEPHDRSRALRQDSDKRRMVVDERRSMNPSAQNGVRALKPFRRPRFGAFCSAHGSAWDPRCFRASRRPS